MFEYALPLAILTVFPAAMAFAGSSDLFTMTISNRLTLGMSAAFFALALWSGMDADTFVNHVSAGGVMLAVGIALFAAGWVGGGDAKLVAATALWLGWGPLLYYAIVVSIAGGVLSLVLLRFRGVPLSGWVERQDWLAKLHRADHGAPYGLALACGGLLAYTKSYWFTSVLV